MSLPAAWSDVRFAIRMLRRYPTFAAAAIATLALGLGATTAVFAVVDATLVRPLPFAAPDRLVGLSSVSRGPDGADIQYAVSEIELVRWRSATRTLAGVEGLQPRSFALTGAGDPEVIRGAAVTSGLWQLLGTAPLRGRAFTREEEAGDAPLAIISHALWRRAFDLDPGAIGATIRLDARAYEIVGIMPPGFRPMLDPSDLWIPLNPKVDPARQSQRMTAGVGRLRPDATPVQADAELAPISAALEREFPVSHGHSRPQVVPLREQLLGDRRPALLALTAAVVVLLALGSANVMNLTLGHVAARRTELTVRALLGARRLQLVQQQLVQGLVLSTAGTAVALLVVMLGLPPLLALYVRNGQPAVDVGLDWRVLAFAGASMVATAIISSVLPAIQAHREAVEGGVSQTSAARIGSGKWEQRTRMFLVGLQVAFAVLLLCGAGVFVNSLHRLLKTSPGFRPDGVLTMQMALPPSKYPDVVARARFVADMLDRVGAVPGILSAGTTQTTFMPNESMQTLLWTDSRPVDVGQADAANIRHVTPGYFTTLQVPLMSGRAINERDRLGTQPVCVVSAAFARAFWPDTSALGHRVRRTSAAAQWMTVVGVAGDVMDAGVGVAAGPTLYVPYLQANTQTARITLVARSHGDPIAASQAVRQAIWSVDPLQPVSEVGRLDDLLVQSVGDQRFRAVLVALFATMGLAVALIGVYGVTATAVASRTRETGIRLALGARPRRLVLELVRQVLVSVAGGAMAGLAAYAACGRLVGQLLYETSAADPRVMGIAATMICAGAIAAAYLRARSIGELSPLIAIQSS